MKRLSLLLLLILCCVACSRKCSKVVVCHIFPPNDIDRPASIIGYSFADVDTQVFVQYKPNGLFDQPVDTTRYVLQPDVHKTDSFRLDIDFSGGDYSSTRVNDVRVILPGANRTYDITDINVNGSYSSDVPYQCKEGDYKVHCDRYVTSLKVDGVAKSYPWSGYFYLYK